MLLFKYIYLVWRIFRYFNWKQKYSLGKGFFLGCFHWSSLGFKVLFFYRSVSCFWCRLVWRMFPANRRDYKSALFWGDIQNSHRSCYTLLISTLPSLHIKQKHIWVTPGVRWPLEVTRHVIVLTVATAADTHACFTLWG